MPLPRGTTARSEGNREFGVTYSWIGGSRRFNLTLLGVFALTALLLAVGAVYGEVAYNVSQRTQEIGVRIALGARNADVLGLILRRGSSEFRPFASASTPILIDSVLFPV